MVVVGSLRLFYPCQRCFLRVRIFRVRKLPQLKINLKLKFKFEFKFKVDRLQSALMLASRHLMYLHLLEHPSQHPEVPLALPVAVHQNLAIPGAPVHPAQM